MTIRATKHTSPHEALQHCECSGDDVALTLAGRHFSARKAELDRIELTYGVQPTVWYDRDGRLLPVVGRDG